MSSWLSRAGPVGLFDFIQRRRVFRGGDWVPLPLFGDSARGDGVMVGVMQACRIGVPQSSCVWL